MLGFTSWRLQSFQDQYQLQ